MGCGCNKRAGVTQTSTQTKNQYDDLTGKFILDTSGNKLLVTLPIYDAYKDVVGYTVKNEDGNSLRIFAKNVQKILD
jgi:hypothetical protein